MSAFWLTNNYSGIRTRLASWNRRAPWSGVVAGLTMCNATTTLPTYLLNAVGLLLAMVSFLTRDKAGVEQCAAFYRQHKSDVRVNAVFWTFFCKFIAGMYFVEFSAIAASHPNSIGFGWTYALICLGMFFLGRRMERRAAPILGAAKN